MTLDVNSKNCLEQRAISSRVQSQELSTELSGELCQADYRLSDCTPSLTLSCFFHHSQSHISQYPLPKPILVLGRWHNCSWQKQREMRSTKRWQITKDVFLVTVAWSRPLAWAFPTFSVPHVSHLPPLYKPTLCAACYALAQNQQNKVPKT